MGVQSKADKFKDSTASDLIPPTTLGVGKKGFGGAVIKIGEKGSYTEGETTFGTPLKSKSDKFEGTQVNQPTSNIPNPNPNGDLQTRDADKGVINPSQGDVQGTTTLPNIDLPQTFFQKNKMPILIGGGVAIVGVIGLIVFNSMSTTE